MVVFELLGRACVQFWLHWRVASLKISCESNVTHKTAKLTSLAFFICKHKGIKQSKTSAVIYYFLKNFLWLSAIPSCKLWKWLELFFFSLPLQIMIPKIKKKKIMASLEKAERSSQCQQFMSAWSLFYTTKGLLQEAGGPHMLLVRHKQSCMLWTKLSRTSSLRPELTLITVFDLCYICLS